MINKSIHFKFKFRNLLISEGLVDIGHRRAA